MWATGASIGMQAHGIHTSAHRSRTLKLRKTCERGLYKLYRGVFSFLYIPHIFRATNVSEHTTVLHIGCFNCFIICTNWTHISEDGIHQSQWLCWGHCNMGVHTVRSSPHVLWLSIFKLMSQIFLFCLFFFLTWQFWKCRQTGNRCRQMGYDL